MPVLYFTRSGWEGPLTRRATLTFGELRGLFGGYESSHVSDQWLQSELEERSSAPARVLVQVSERDGTAKGYERPGFYVLGGLPPAKVDELLKYRESHSQRLNEADRWQAAHTHVPRRRQPC